MADSEENLEQATEEIKEQTSQPEAEGKTEAQPEEKPQRNRYSRRVQELNTKYREVERQLEEERKMRLELEEKSKIKTEPDPLEYDDNTKYRADQEQWRAQEKERLKQEAIAEVRQEARRHQEEKEVAQRNENWAKQKRKGIKDFEDFEKHEASVIEVVKATGAIDISETILESEKGAALVHHLGSDPDLLDEIADLPPKSQVRKLLQIEATLEAKPVKKTSSAPDPATGIKAGASVTDRALKSKYAPRKGESFAEMAKRLNGYK